MTYEVQQYTFCEGWVNTWQIHHEDGRTEPEAEAPHARHRLPNRSARLAPAYQ